jgi:hypothetical protein
MRTSLLEGEIVNMKLAIAVPLLVLAAAMSPGASAANHWKGDIRHFHDRDAHHWATGHWYQGRHDGRLGWWWVVGTAINSAIWYAYSAPVYPYPDPYVPPALVVAPVPAAPPPLQAAPATAYWYYCASSKQYYPYVAACPEGWKAVPAAPAEQ